MASNESTFRDRLRRGVRIASILSTVGVSLLAFQNFSPLSLDKLKPVLTSAEARVTREEHTDVDIRQLAPRKPSGYDTTKLAAPQSGTDLDSISRDWMMRQTHLLTGGVEQQMLAKLNEKMNRMMKFEEVEGEPWPEPGDAIGAGDPKADDGNQTPNVPPTVPEENEERSSSRWRPRSVKFVSINRLQMGLANDSSLTCSFSSDSIALDLSTQLTSNSGLSLHHESGNAKSTLRFNYSW